MGNDAPYFEDAAVSRHETEETDLYPHPQNVPIGQSEQSHRLRALKRQVEYSNQDYDPYNDPARYEDEYGDDMYERRPSRIRSPFQGRAGRRQRSARNLDNDPYYDEPEQQYDDERPTRTKRMYSGRMPPYNERAGRLSQQQQGDNAESVNM